MCFTPKRRVERQDKWLTLCLFCPVFGGLLFWWVCFLPLPLSSFRFDIWVLLVSPGPCLFPSVWAIATTRLENYTISPDFFVHPFSSSPLWLFVFVWFCLCFPVCWRPVRLLSLLLPGPSVSGSHQPRCSGPCSLPLLLVVVSLLAALDRECTQCVGSLVRTAWPVSTASSGKRSWVHLWLWGLLVKWVVWPSCEMWWPMGLSHQDCVEFCDEAYLCATNGCWAFLCGRPHLGDSMGLAHKLMVFWVAGFCRPTFQKGVCPAPCPGTASMTRISLLSLLNVFIPVNVFCEHPRIWILWSRVKAHLICIWTLSEPFFLYCDGLQMWKAI